MARTNYRIRERLALRSSGIHGKGVFAREHIPAGTRIIEYEGERITDAQGDERYPYDPNVPYHTFLFKLDDDVLLDGGTGGNVSKWINHSCDPNCESVIEDERIFVDAIRDIEPGDELTYDYFLIVPERHTAAVKRRYPCICGKANCRGTMLTRKR
jgi:SET domain-containing protein